MGQPGNSLIVLPSCIHNVDSPYVLEFKKSIPAGSNRYKKLTTGNWAYDAKQLITRDPTVTLLQRTESGPYEPPKSDSMVDTGANSAVASLDVLLANEIRIPRNNTDKIKLSGIHGEETVHDRVQIVVELFGNRVDSQGYEVKNFHMRESIMLEISVVILEGSNVPLLLGLHESTQAEFVIDCRTGRIMRMSQPFGPDQLIYKPDMVFHSKYSHPCNNRIPMEDEEKWVDQFQRNVAHERKEYKDTITHSFDQCLLHQHVNGEPLDPSRYGRNLLLEPCTTAASDVLGKCTRPIMANLATMLGAEASIHVNVARVEQSAKDRERDIINKLRQKWEPILQSLADLPLLGDDLSSGTTPTADALMEANLWWGLSDELGESLDAESFHYLLTQGHLREEDVE